MRSNFHILCLGHFDKNVRSLQLIGYDIVVDVAVSQASNKMGFIAVNHDRALGTKSQCFRVATVKDTCSGNIKI